MDDHPPYWQAVLSEHTAFQNLGDTAGGLLAKAKGLQRHIDGAAHYVEQQQLRQKATELLGRIGDRAAERLASVPPALDVPPEMLHNLSVQAQCWAAVEELERLHARTGQLLQSARGALDVVQRAHGTWQHMLMAQSNRWHNQHSSTIPVLLLPQGVLHAITHLAGRHTRLVCTALRHAYGPPATSVDINEYLLETSEGYRLHGSVDDATFKLGPAVRRWPWPGSVTTVKVDWELSPQDFQAVVETFPHMQLLKLTVPVTLPLDALPPGLTSLHIGFAGYCSQEATVDLGATTHLTALQHLSVECADILPRGWAPLSCLASLTRLRFTEYHQSTSYRGDFDVDVSDDSADWQRGRRSVLERMAIWQALAALPQLQEVHLNKYLDWHSRLPEGVAQLAALTCLLLRCSSHMMEPSSTGGEAPVSQVFRLLPALSSLTLWRTDQLLGRRMVDTDRQSRVLQALQVLPLQRLSLDQRAPSAFFLQGLRSHLPSLTSLRLPGGTYEACGADAWGAVQP